MIFTYNQKNYEVKIIKKRNKNTYIRIKEGYIYVTTSYFISNLSIKKLLEENRKSIEKMIEKNNKKEEKKKNFYYFGIPYKIIIEEIKTIDIDHNNKTIFTKNEEMLNQYLRKEAKLIFSNHLKEYYYKFEENIEEPTLKIRKMKSRWGVCNTKTKNITLNLELIHYSIECLDYVIVHELSHLIEPNHSKKFWNIVSKYYPNYKEIRKKLRD